MGKNQIHCGEAGSGGTVASLPAPIRIIQCCMLCTESVKLCNNLALAVQMIGTSEALALVIYFCISDLSLLLSQ